MIYKHVIYRAARLSSVVCLRAALCVALVACFAAPALALESPSYRLYDSLPNYGSNGTPDTSANYLLNENGVTWFGQPIVSTNYQLVTAPPAAQSSSSSSGYSSRVSSEANRPSGGHRGTRPVPPQHPSAGKSSSVSSVRSLSSSRPSSAAFSAVSSSSVFGVIAPSIPCTSEAARIAGCTEQHPSAPCLGGNCQCDRSWSFGGMCVVVPFSTWSWFGLLCALIEVLLLLRIFRPCSARPSPCSRASR